MTPSYLRQFEAVWRLDEAGQWSAIYRGERDASPQAEQTSELFAALCLERLEPGVELTARQDDQLWIARRDPHSVLIAMHHEAANPLMIRTAMKRLEETSARHDATTSLRGLPTTATAPPPAMHIAPRHLVSLAPPPAQDDVSARPSSHPFEVSETLDLDAWLGDEPSVQIARLSQTSQSVSVNTSAPRKTWGDVFVFIEQTIVAASKLVGERVALNYWRQALAEHDAISPMLRVDSRSGLELLVARSSSITRGHDALDQALETWVSRCRRVIPDITQTITALGTPPWRDHAAQ